MKHRVNTFLSILFDSMRPLKLIMLFTYILTGVALYLRADDNTSDVHLVFHVFATFGLGPLAHLLVWELICLYIAIARYVGLFHWQGVWYTRRTTPIFGIILWSFLFASAATAAQFGMGLLYIVCALIEVWILGRAFSENKLGIN